MMLTVKKDLCNLQCQGCTLRFARSTWPRLGHIFKSRSSPYPYHPQGGGEVLRETSNAN